MDLTLKHVLSLTVEHKKKLLDLEKQNQELNKIIEEKNNIIEEREGFIKNNKIIIINKDNLEIWKFIRLPHISTIILRLNESLTCYINFPLSHDNLLIEFLIPPNPCIPNSTSLQT